jgi:hypothetical protein
MNRAPDTYQVAQWCTWAACIAAVVGAAIAVGASAAGPNRVLGVAPPFVIAAILLVVAASQRAPWISGLLYGVGILALLYGIITALALPLRLLIEGTCPLTTTSCPVGFEHPASSTENLVVYAANIAGGLAVILVLVAIEARFIHGSRRIPDRPEPPPSLP